jgi:DNA polymerase-3 subunit delta
MRGKEKRSDASPDVPVVVLIHGADHGLKMRRIEELRRSLVDEQYSTFDYQEIDGRAVGAAEILAAAQMLPFASRRRLVVVRSVEKLRPAEQQQLASGIKELAPRQGQNPAACLVLVTDDEESEKQQAAVKTLEAAVRACGGSVISAKAPKSAGATQLVRQIAAELGAEIAADAAEMLIHKVGTETDVLTTELEKLHSYAGGGRITAKHVEEAASSSPEYDIFALTDAVSRRDRTSALRVLHSLLASGTSPYAVIPMLARQFRMIWIAKLFAERGVLNEQSLKSMPQELKKLIPQDPDISKMSWRAHLLAEEAASFTWEELEKKMKLVFDADLRMKGILEGAEDQRALLETLIVRLCSRSAAKSRV